MSGISVQNNIRFKSAPQHGLRTAFVTSIASKVPAMAMLQSSQLGNSLTQTVQTSLQGAAYGSIPWLAMASSRKLAFDEFLFRPLQSSSRLARELPFQETLSLYVPKLVRWQGLLNRARSIKLDGKLVEKSIDLATNTLDAKRAATLTRPFRIAGGTLALGSAIWLYKDAQYALKQDALEQGREVYGRHFKKFIGKTTGGFLGGAIGGGMGRIFGGQYNSPIVHGLAITGGAIGANIGEGIADKYLV